MHRFFVRSQDIQERTAVIQDMDSIRKARQVLRMQPGDKLGLFDGEGMLYTGEVEKLTREMLLVKITDRDFHERDRAYYVLAQALPRAGKLEQIAKMCTEIGVDEFIFFPSERSIGRQARESIKLERFKRIAIEAARQSERLYVPEFGFVDEFEKLLQLDVEHKLVLSARSSDGAVDILELKRPAQTDRVLFVVGPEGGFSAAEMSEFDKHGFVSVSMRLPILRVETAAVASAALLIANK